MDTFGKENSKYKRSESTRTYFRGGFTLIELLVVISIISMLSSVVLSSLSDTRVKARDAKRIHDLKQIQIALELYRNDHGGKYPPANGPYFSYTASWSTLSSYLVPNYISELPIDPINNGNISAAGKYTYYFYAGAPKCNTNNCYDLLANLEDPDSPYMCKFKKYTQQYNGAPTTWCPTLGGFFDRVYSPLP
jgi:prepilin-type N-terminal cleavage/methylation domain-containing protein